MTELPTQCNVALISNYQGQGEYRNLSYEYCDTTAKYSEKQMRDYGRAEYLRGLEDAAKVCCKLAPSGRFMNATKTRKLGDLVEAEELIRALVGEVK